MSAISVYENTLYRELCLSIAFRLPSVVLVKSKPAKKHNMSVHNGDHNAVVRIFVGLS